MKKPLSLCVILVTSLCLVLTSCGSATPATTTTAQPPTSSSTTSPTVAPPTTASNIPLATTTVSANTRTINYYDNMTITVPLKITRVASGWNAQNSILAMLGYGPNIVATTDIIKAAPIFARFCPSIKDAVVCFTSAGQLNLESLLQSKPDVAFIMQSGSAAGQFKRVEENGIPVAYLKDSSLKNLTDRTLITGQILGEEAYRKAQLYINYYNFNVDRVTRRVSQIPQSQRVRLYHSMGSPLATSNAPSLNQDWMDMAGVINVARDWKLAAGQTGTTANLEQIVGANPDVILCMNAVDAQTIKTDPGWSTIKAVKDGKVIVNPKGMFWWCRETTEEALQFLWLAKTVYPELFTDIDMVQETRYFYKTFYGYDLTDADVQMFLYPK